MPIVNIPWVYPEIRSTSRPIDPHTIVAWSTDFVRAMTERPLWARLIFRIVVGKYAYREFIGLIDCLDAGGHLPFFGYGIENCDYHKDKVRNNWWEEPRKDGISK